MQAKFGTLKKQLGCHYNIIQELGNSVIKMEVSYNDLSKRVAISEENYKDTHELYEDHQ